MAWGDGFLVQLRLLVKGLTRIPAWGRIVIACLVLSIVGNGALIWTQHTVVSDAKQAVSQANAALVVARQERDQAQQATVAAQASAQRQLQTLAAADRECIQATIAAYLGGMTPSAC